MYTLQSLLPVMQCLCEEGADKEARCDNDMTSLDRSVTHNHAEVAEYLRNGVVSAIATAAISVGELNMLD